jgi:hypothetical protein
MIRPTCATLLLALPFGIAVCTTTAHGRLAPDSVPHERTDAAAKGDANAPVTLGAKAAIKRFDAPRSPDVEQFRTGKGGNGTPR